MSDIVPVVEVLRSALDKPAPGQPENKSYALVDCLVQRGELMAAIGEIEYLRALAGAVSPGPSLADLKAEQCQCGAAKPA